MSKREGKWLTEHKLIKAVVENKTQHMTDKKYGCRKQAPPTATIIINLQSVKHPASWAINRLISAYIYHRLDLAPHV